MVQHGHGTRNMWKKGVVICKYRSLHSPYYLTGQWTPLSQGGTTVSHMSVVTSHHLNFTITSQIVLISVRYRFCSLACGRGAWTVLAGRWQGAPVEYPTDGSTARIVSSHTTLHAPVHVNQAYYAQSAADIGHRILREHTKRQPPLCPPASPPLLTLTCTTTNASGTLPTLRSVRTGEHSQGVDTAAPLSRVRDGEGRSLPREARERESVSKGQGVCRAPAGAERGAGAARE